MYANGDGISKDEVKAVKWLRKAAEQGLSFAKELIKGSKALMELDELISEQEPLKRCSV